MPAPALVIGVLSGIDDAATLGPAAPISCCPSIADLPDGLTLRGQNGPNQPRRARWYRWAIAAERWRTYR